MVQGHIYTHILCKNHICLVLSISAPKAITIATVYRPPKPNEAFMSEFADLLSMLCFKFKNILILGDFNIHIDQNDYVDKGLSIFVGLF